MNKKLILVTGCLCGGIEQMGEILSSHEDIEMISHFKTSLVTDDGLSKHLLLKWKTASYDRIMLTKYPGTRCIWMIRDPRTAIGATDPSSSVSLEELANATMVLSNQDNGNQSLFNHLMPLYTAPPEQRGKALGPVRALQWLLSVKLYESHRDAGCDIHLVRYEDLLERPTRTILEVTNFLEVPWRDSLLEHQESAAPSQLSNTQHEAIRDICGEVAASYGYDF